MWLTSANATAGSRGLTPFVAPPFLPVAPLDPVMLTAVLVLLLLALLVATDGEQ